MVRLQQALTLVGYNLVQDLERKRKLVEAILELSARSGDAELERACTEELAILTEKAQLDAFLAFCLAIETHLRDHYGMSPEEAKRAVDSESEWLAEINAQDRDAASAARTIAHTEE